MLRIQMISSDILQYSKVNLGITVADGLDARRTQIIPFTMAGGPGGVELEACVSYSMKPLR